MNQKYIKIKDPKKRKGGSSSIVRIKNDNLGTLFPSWELSEYPKSLGEGIRRAEKRDYIRFELHKLQKNRGLGVKTLHRNKYSRLNGNIGYEQLRLLNLVDGPDVCIYFKNVRL
jgi:hypothetical protein